jgi:hypothetical protein
MASATQPVYFELSWSILSTIGLTNALFGVLVAGITTFSPISAVPIFTSLSCAIANGLCYYAFYHDSYPVTNRAVASAFADVAWMVGTNKSPCLPTSSLPIAELLTDRTDTRSRVFILQLHDTQPSTSQ